MPASLHNSAGHCAQRGLTPQSSIPQRFTPARMPDREPDGT